MFIFSSLLNHKWEVHHTHFCTLRFSLEDYSLLVRWYQKLFNQYSREGPCSHFQTSAVCINISTPNPRHAEGSLGGRLLPQRARLICMPACDWTARGPVLCWSPWLFLLLSRGTHPASSVGCCLQRSLVTRSPSTKGPFLITTASTKTAKMLT